MIVWRTYVPPQTLACCTHHTDKCMGYLSFETQVEISYLVSQWIGNFRTSRNNQRCPPQRNHGKVEHLPNCWLKAHVKCLCSDGNFGKDLSLEHCEARISDTERWRTWLYIHIYIYVFLSFILWSWMVCFEFLFCLQVMSWMMSCLQLSCRSWEGS